MCDVLYIYYVPVYIIGIARLIIVFVFLILNGCFNAQCNGAVLLLYIAHPLTALLLISDYSSGIIAKQKYKCFDWLFGFTSSLIGCLI